MRVMVLNLLVYLVKSFPFIEELFPEVPTSNSRAIKKTNDLYSTYKFEIVFAMKSISSELFWQTSD